MFDPELMAAMAEYIETHSIYENHYAFMAITISHYYRTYYG